MRVLKKNKQVMYYSKIVGEQEVYEKDSSGNIKYTQIIEDGETISIPIPTGTKKPMYGTPVKFSSSISSSLNPLQMRAWGVDQSNIWSQVDVPKGYLPLSVGDIVWRENEIGYDSDNSEMPDAATADYTCKGIMTEGLYEDLYLLQRNSSEGDN